MPHLAPKWGHHSSLFLFLLAALGLLGIYSHAQATDSSSIEPSSLASETKAAQTITISSGCEGNRQIAARVYGDSIVVHEILGNNDTSHVVVLSANRRRSADSLFTLLNGLGGAMILRCPNVEAVTCRFEASLERNKIECTNCSACSDDLDRMSLATLHRLKALLRDLNLFL